MDLTEGQLGGSSASLPPVGQPLARSRKRVAATEGTEPSQPVAGESGPLTGRVSLVAGISSPLGEAFVSSLAQRGSRLVLLDGDASVLRATTARHGGTDGTLALRCDLASTEDRADAIRFLDLAGIRPDVVVLLPSSLVDAAAGLEVLLARDVCGTLELARALASMQTSGSHIIFVDTPELPGAEQGSLRVTAAARRQVVELVRSEASAAGIEVLSVAVPGGGVSAKDEPATSDAAAGSSDGRPDAIWSDVSELALDALDRTMLAEVVELVVEERAAAPDQTPTG